MKAWGGARTTPFTIIREVSVVVLALRLAAVAVPSADAVLLVEGTSPSAAAPEFDTDTDQADIPTRDGITLSAVIVTPSGKPTTGTRWPLDLALSVLSDREGRPAPELKEFFTNATDNVAGTRDAATKLAPVRVAPRTPWGTTFIDSGLASHFDFESYATPAVRRTQRQYLTSSSSLYGVPHKTELTADAGTGGTTLRQGKNLLLNNGIPLIQGGFEIIFDSPTTVPLGASTYVVGHKPYSWSGATPGAKLPIDVTIPYNAYDVPKGHWLIVGVSTSDVLYTDNNPAGSTVTVGPDSFVDLPLL